jgi:ABC-type branched-subunit amino acid transport system substrate-binding protein
MIHRSSLAAIVAAAGIVATLTGCSMSSDGAPSTETIKIGLLTDLSGAAGIFGPPTQNAAELAVEEINAAGGVNGQNLELLVADETGVPTAGVAAAQRLIQEDGIVALFGQHNSATRDAVAPVTSDAGLAYFHTPLAEGNFCSANVISNGEVPAQQLAPAIPYLQTETGNNKWFLLGADYIWGQTVLADAEKYILASGGEVVGKELVPIGTTDFQSVITKIKQSGAQLIIPAIFGGDAITFEKQAFDAGVGNAAVQRLGVIYEDGTLGAMGAEITNGMFVSMAYNEALDTEANAAFLAAYYAKFGDDAAPQSALSEQTYVAIHAWAVAANQAKSTASVDVLSALSGQSYDGPSGTVTFGPDHFATQSIVLTRVQPDGVSVVATTFDSVSPEQTCSEPMGK